jgi:signal transduction histidine kinase
MAAPFPPARLAVCLSLPLVLLAAAGVWLLRSERVRAEVEVRRDAELWVVFGLEEIGGAASEEAVAALAVVVPPAESPAPGAEAAELAAIRSEIRAGRRNAAMKRLLALRSRPGVESAVSEAGLPVPPLLERMVFELRPEPPTAEVLARAAVRHPSMISEALVEDAAKVLSPEQAERWRGRAREAGAAVATLSRGTSVPGWVVVTRDDGGREAISLKEVGRVVEAKTAAVSRVLPPGLGVRVDWSGQVVVPAAGEELVARARAPWRVAVVLTDPAVVTAAAGRRGRWLGWMLAGALAVTAFALWAAWRAFRRQAELTRAQMEFVASVSHELRTPVASITALAERLESGQADATQTHEYHGLIGREGRRLAALVENVLDFSRLERGQRAFVLEPADLPALVRETTALLRPRADDKGLTLVESIAEVPDHRWPAVDAVALRQALVNLIDNAVKFTPAGGRIEVSFAEQAGAVVIGVGDTGIGIEADERRRIFEKFYRVDNSLTRETTGAGIGLSLVRHIAEAHGARVVVESEPGRSSRFTLHFPAVPCASS